jgi:RNA polymerase sigma factor (sigma-70 family)
MAVNQMSEVISHLRRAMLLRDGAGLTDGQLLEDYIRRHEEAALAALVHRHGPMVWGVCRRVLRNYHDAEDAFQATFLVLVRKAASVVPREMIANWLYGVAHQTALKARATAAKRRARERQVTRMPEPVVTEPDLWHDLQPLLDQELNHLPDIYRVAIVLCDLEGKTRKETARQLGVPEGTVAGRLARARVMLAKRLARHGPAASGGALAVLLSQHVASAGVPSSVASSTIKAATLFAAGQTAATGVISAKVVALTEGVLKTMLLTKLKIATAVLLLAGVGVGVGVALPHTRAQQTPTKEPERKKESPPAAKQATNGWKALKTLKGHEDPVQCLTFGPNNVLVSGGKDGHVRVWEADTGKELLTFQNQTGGISGITYAPDDSWVAFRFENGIALSFDKTIKDGKPIHIGRGIGLGDLVPLALAPDGKTYAWREGKSNTVEVFDQDLMQEVVGEVKNRASCKGHTDEPLCAAFSPGGMNLLEILLATGSADKTARIWDAFTGKEKFTLKGHADAVVVVEFSADAKTLATGGKDGTVKLWDMVTGKEIATLKGHDVVRCLAFSPDGKSLASGGDDRTIRVWDTVTGKERTALKGHTDAIAAVRFNRDGTLLASAGADKTVRLWHYQK